MHLVELVLYLYYFNINIIYFQLCEVCRRKVAKETVKDQSVLPVLGQLGTSFCTFMSDNVFTQNTRQTIQRSRNDAEALGHIRDVSRQMFNCFYGSDIIHVSCIILSQILSRLSLI